MSAQPLRVVFSGTPDFAAAHLDAVIASQHNVVAVYTQPDRRAGRGKKLQPSPVKVRALQADLPVYQPSSLRDESAQAELRALAPDVLVVVAYGLILPQAVLDIPNQGCINVHASLLPRWRGAAPIQRAVEAGDAISGVTIMAMEAGLDTGPMLAMESLTLSPEETGGSLHDRLIPVGRALLVETLDKLDSRLLNATIQNNEQATYAHKIQTSDAEINWLESAESLARRINAFNPVPGCFSTLQGERIKIWSAYATTGAPSQPGTVLSVGREGLTVACGEGVLCITEAQLPGAKRQHIADLVNGQSQRLPVGAQFSAVEPTR